TAGAMTPGRFVASVPASAEFARAYTLTGLTAVFAPFLIERVTSATTLATLLGAIAIIGVGMLFIRREELSLLRVAPTSLLGFLALAIISVLWSSNRAHSVLGWLTLVGCATIAITIGHVRDTLQTVRAIGDTLRWLLALSLGLEILSGILLDMPFAAF